MRTSKIKLPFNYFHYYGFSVLIGCLAVVNYFFLLLYVPYLYLIRFYQKKHLVFIVGIIFIVYTFLYEYIFKIEPVNDEFIITKKITNDDYYTYYVKQDFNKYLFYSNSELKVGDQLKINYRYEEFSGSRTPNGFSLKNYYASKRIFYKLIVNDVIVISSNKHINTVKENLKTKLDRYPFYTRNYLKTFLFADDSFEAEHREARVSLGIIHLFAISGLHVSFLIGVISFLFNRLKIKVNKYIIISVLIIYLWLADMQISLLRVTLMYGFYHFLKDKGISRLDSLSLTFIFILIINPFYMYRTGFVLSFLISFLIVITPNKNDLKARFILHIKIMLVSLLIVSNLNGGIYLLSLITGFVFSVIFPVIILPVIMISIIPFISVIIEPILAAFSILILNLNNDYLLKIPYQNLFFIMLYSGLAFYVLLAEDNKVFLKRTLIIVFYVGILYITPYFYLNKTVYFLDVGQGDATFIQNTNNKGNILIDANTGTLDFLKTLGNIKIEYFFITHGDLDHAAEAEGVINYFKVNNVVVNTYDESPLINELKQDNLKRASIGNVYNINGIKVSVLGPLKNYNNSNDNSLVLLIEESNQKILFTGDISILAINDLINFYGYGLKSDILHVAHHGAKHSTPVELLRYVRPKEAVISVGKNNYYNHPHYETIENLEAYNVEIYLTSKQQTIIKRKYRFSLFKQ